MSIIIKLAFDEQDVLQYYHEHAADVERSL